MVMSAGATLTLGSSVHVPTSVTSALGMVRTPSSRMSSGIFRQFNRPAAEGVTGNRGIGNSHFFGIECIFLCQAARHRQEQKYHIRRLWYEEQAYSKS